MITLSRRFASLVDAEEHRVETAVISAKPDSAGKSSVGGSSTGSIATSGAMGMSGSEGEKKGGDGGPVERSLAFADACPVFLRHDLTNIEWQLAETAIYYSGEDLGFQVFSRNLNDKLGFVPKTNMTQLCSTNVLADGYSLTSAAPAETEEAQLARLGFENLRADAEQIRRELMFRPPLFGQAKLNPRDKVEEVKGVIGPELVGVDAEKSGELMRAALAMGGEAAAAGGDGTPQRTNLNLPSERHELFLLENGPEDIGSPLLSPSVSMRLGELMADSGGHAGGHRGDRNQSMSTSTSIAHQTAKELTAKNWVTKNRASLLHSQLEHWRDAGWFLLADPGLFSVSCPWEGGKTVGCPWER